MWFSQLLQKKFTTDKVNDFLNKFLFQLTFTWMWLVNTIINCKNICSILWHLVSQYFDVHPKLDLTTFVVKPHWVVKSSRSFKKSNQVKKFPFLLFGSKCSLKTPKILCYGKKCKMGEVELFASKIKINVF